MSNDLKKQIRYEPASGVLTWLETEELPEEVISNHYLYIVLNDKSFTKKRLIMLWMTILKSSSQFRLVEPQSQIIH
jgi:hypothetical protein